MAYVQIENARASAHVLPPLPGFPDGRRLIPGTNNVPADYVKALKKKLSGSQNTFVDDQGFTKQIDGWEHFLKTNDWLSVSEVPYEAPKREGPVPPKSLADREPEAAVAFVEFETDEAVLKSWLKTDKREEVKAAIKDRLEGLKNSAKK